MSASAASDWTDVAVEEIKASTENALATGPFGSSISARFFEDRGVPVIRGSNLSSDGRTRLNEDGLVFVSASKAKEFRRSLVRKGDLIFTSWGTINQVGLIDESATYPAYVISNKQMKLTPHPQKADGTFLFYLFSGPDMQRVMLNQGIGSSVPGFNLGQLRKMRLRLPPLPEQVLIAEALGDADTQQNSLSRLIAKKRNIKLAIAQQLLSGRHRLPGSTGPWEVKQLSEIGHFSKGKGIQKDQVVPDGVPCVRYGEIYTRHTDHIRTFYSHIPREVAVHCRRLHKGDLLFAGSGETAEEIGKCVAFLGDAEAYVGGDIVILNAPGHDAAFLGYLMNSAPIAEQKARVAQGDAVVHISAKDLAQVTACLPQAQEQAAIASVLCDLDAEVEALERRFAKTRDLKRAMMQELLTGSTRIT